MLRPYHGRPESRRGPPRTREPARLSWHRPARLSWHRRGERYRQDERLFLIEEGREYQSWALAEKLCAESEQAAKIGELDKALELAEAAVAITGFLPGPEEWRAHVEGYCRGFVSNAQRAAGRLDEAQHTYETACLLWQRWTPDPALLQESRLQELGEALRGDLNQETVRSGES